MPTSWRVDLGDDFSALIQTTTWSISFHETARSISEFLRRHDVPTTFEAIYQGLKPDLREAWGRMALPEGRGAISAEAYQTRAVREPPGNPAPPQHCVRWRGCGSYPASDHTLHCAVNRAAGELPIAGRAGQPLTLANHTVLASSVGLPGISLPAGLSRGGLPIGLELDAPWEGTARF